MLTGAYIVPLSEQYALRLPKKIAAVLCSHCGRHGKSRQVCFAAAQHLRCYSLEGVRAYVSELQSINNVQARVLLRLTVAHGLAVLSPNGLLRIPDAFCTAYNLMPSTEIHLMGCGEHIELRQGEHR